MKANIFSLIIFFSFSYTMHAMDSSDDTSSSPKDSHFNPSDEESNAIFWAEITARYTISSDEKRALTSSSDQESNDTTTHMQRGTKRPAPEETKQDPNAIGKRCIANINLLANQMYDFCAHGFPAGTSDEAIQQALREHISGIYTAQDKLHEVTNQRLDIDKPVQALKSDFKQGLELLEKLQENVDTLMAAEVAFRISQKRRYARTAALLRAKLTEFPLLSDQQ